MDRGSAFRPGFRPGLVLLAGAMVAPSLTAFAAELTLAWDPNTESNLAGYKLYYDTDGVEPYDGTFFSQGPSPIQIPLSGLANPALPEFRVAGVAACTVVHFALTAYDTNGAESDFSNRVSGTALITPAPVTVTPLPGGIQVGWQAPSPLDTAIDHYEVLYDVDPGEPYAGTGASQGDSPITVPLASVDPVSPTYALTGLPPAVTVHAAVAFVCPDGTRKVSGSNSAAPLPGDADGGFADAAASDGGIRSDATPADSGVAADASATQDSGAPPDSGAPRDASVVAGKDASVAGPGTDPLGGGCGCSVSRAAPRSSLAGCLALLATLLFLRRRRPRAS